MSVNLGELREMVSSGQIFAVEFIKRTNGEHRKMLCRLGVKKHLKGGTQAYNPSEYNLLTVFDMEKGAYRMINIDGIISLKIAGQEYGDRLPTLAERFTPPEMPRLDSNQVDYLISQLKGIFKN